MFVKVLPQQDSHTACLICKHSKCCYFSPTCSLLDKPVVRSPARGKLSSRLSR